MKLYTLFTNTNENRLRSGWRVLFFMVTALIMATSVSLILPSGLPFMLGLSVGSILLLWLFGLYIDNRPLRDFGLQFNRVWWLELAGGTILGGSVILLLFAIALITGDYEITGYGWEKASAKDKFWSGFATYLIIMICVGFYEELLFRGYLNLNLFEGLKSANQQNPWIPALVSILIISGLFGLAHANNPNATTFGIINVTLAGVMLGIPFLATGRLALSIGIHFAWNFVQGGIVGVSVSGIASTSSLLTSRGSDNHLLTGGPFGFEGGLLGTFGVILILGCILLYLKYRSKDQAGTSKFNEPEAISAYS